MSIPFFVVCLAFGILIAALWRLRQWLAYGRAMRALDDETKWKRGHYAHCEAQPVSMTTTAPPARVTD